jgi:hypothetical protein
MKKNFSLTFYNWQSRFIVWCHGGIVVNNDGMGNGGTHSKGSNDNDDGEQ